MRAIRKIAEEEGLTPENGVRVRLTGGLALSTEELSSVFEGAKSASLLSLTLVSICLLFGLRSLTLVVATVVMLICGLIWTAGFATAVVGHLNLLSVAFAVLFIGLGVDFGIHLALRFAEEFPATTSKNQKLYGLPHVLLEVRWHCARYRQRLDFMHSCRRLIWGSLNWA